MAPPPPDLVTASPWTWTATSEPAPTVGAYAGLVGAYGPRVTHEARTPAGDLVGVIWPTDSGGRRCSVRRNGVHLSSMTLPRDTPDAVARDLVDTLITLWSTP